MRLLLEHSQDHVILIDDARLFTGRDDYPTLAELEEQIARQGRGHQVFVADDIVYVIPYSREAKTTTEIGFPERRP